MQLKEQPSLSPKETWPANLPKYEDLRANEKVTAKKLWTALGDVARDIGTANEMARDKFDGDSAIMHVARGAVTTGVGVGLEKAMDFVWDKVWTGDIPFYDKSKFGSGMAEAMNRFANQNDKTARLTQFIKSGTQDLSIALFYNFMAFRSQPILPKAGPEHLVRSLGIDALEALTMPSIPAQIYDTANASDVAVNEAKLRSARRDLSDASRLRETTTVKEFELDPNAPSGTLAEDFKKKILKTQTVTKYEFEDQRRELQGKIRELKSQREVLNDYEPQYNPDTTPKVEKLIQSVLDASNPVTHLGIEWMASGVTTFIRNIKEVRKVRKEKGGLLGKNVVMPKNDERRWKGGGDKPWQKDRSWQDRRQQSDYKTRDEHPDSGKNKVYYGQSKSEEKKLEEYELKGN